MRNIHVGCGASPIVGWENYDNSFSLFLAKFPYGIITTLYWIKLLNLKQFDFIKFNKKNCINRLDASKKLPFKDAEISVIYTSHMIEHLSQKTAIDFFRECNRVPVNLGVLRVSVPDFQILIDQYGRDRDVDKFLRESHLVISNDQNMLQKFKNLISGYRHHQHMYNGSSLVKVLLSCGFSEAKIMKPGEINIIDPGELNLSE